MADVDVDDDGDTFSYLNETPQAYWEWREVQERNRPFKRMRTRRGFIAMGFAAIAGAGAAGVPMVTEGRFYPGTHVAGVDISQQPRSTALSLLQSHFAQFETTAIDFVFGEQRWDASLAELGYQIDYDATLDAAYRHGRDGSVVTAYTRMLLSPEERDFPIVFQHDETSLPAFLDNLATELVGAARDARLYLSHDGVKIIPNQDGRRLDTANAERDTRNQIETAVRGTVTLRTVPVVSQITVEEYEPLKDQANTLISAPVTVSLEDNSWTIDVETLRSALRLPLEGKLDPPTLDSETLTAAVASVQDAVYVAPVDAQFGWDGGLYVIQNDRKGQEANLDQLVQDIAAAAASNDSRSIRVPLNDVLANARADNTDELGITDLIAEGSSMYAGSSEARAANVEVSAGHLTHTLLTPGQVVSFNDILGRISVENGFVEGKIIRGNWIESDIGGGACQASTTVYRAVLQAGLPIQEWHAHQFRLEFYELDGSPPGLDAAIYQPNYENEGESDLVFTNDTGTYLLLEMIADTETVYCRLYGTPNSRQVDISVPYISDPIQPEGPVEVEDAKLKKNERVKVQSAAPGYNVEAIRVVTENGAEILRDDMWSRYSPVRETWMIGPGTKRQFPEPTAT